MGERDGGHRRFGGHGGRGQGRPRIALPVADRPSSRSTLRWVPCRNRLLRRQRQQPAPPDSAMTPSHGHGRARRRRRAWRPPGGRGGSTSKQDRNPTDCQPSDRSPDSPVAFQTPSSDAAGRHLPTAPGQRNPSRTCATACTWSGSGVEADPGLVGQSSKTRSAAALLAGRGACLAGAWPPRPAPCPQRACPRGLGAADSHDRLHHHAGVGQNLGGLVGLYDTARSVGARGSGHARAARMDPAGDGRDSAWSRSRTPHQARSP
jgi:hypothetical protein